MAAHAYAVRNRQLEVLRRHAESFVDFNVQPAKLNAKGKRLRGKQAVRAVLMMRAVESAAASGMASPVPMTPKDIRAAVGKGARIDNALESLVTTDKEVVKTAHGKYVYDTAKLEGGLGRLAHRMAKQPNDVEVDDDEPP